MFIKKNNYYIYIENLKSVNLNFIKIKDKFNIIYRNNLKKENKNHIFRFIKKCKKKNIGFFLANDPSFAIKIGANGVYVSSYNKEILKKNTISRKRLELIGSAHNFKEISIKAKQGCQKIILSRLFKTNYPNKSSFFGTTKFNLMTRNYKYRFIALGGIRNNNLMKLNITNFHIH